jgi:hypothetical protein
MGGRISQALAEQHDGPLQTRGQLHGLLLVENLRQGRHRHLETQQTDYPRTWPEFPQSRATRLLTRGQLFPVSPFQQPVEYPLVRWRLLKADQASARKNGAGERVALAD